MMLSAFDKYVRAAGAMSPPAESCAPLVHPVATTTIPVSAAHAGMRSERPRPIRPQALVTRRNPNVHDHPLTSSQMETRTHEDLHSLVPAGEPDRTGPLASLIWSEPPTTAQPPGADGRHSAQGRRQTRARARPPYRSAPRRCARWGRPGRTTPGASRVRFSLARWVLAPRTTWQAPGHPRVRVRVILGR
jgi:hypothetical protein